MGVVTTKNIISEPTVGEIEEPTAGEINQFSWAADEERGVVYAIYTKYSTTKRTQRPPYSVGMRGVGQCRHTPFLVSGRLGTRGDA